MLSKVNNNTLIANILKPLFFIVAAIAIGAEYFEIFPLIAIFKPMIPTILMFLYWVSSSKRQSLFFVVMLFSVLTNIFLALDNPDMLFFGMLSLLIIRLIIIFLLIRILNIKDYIPVTLATIPIMVVFFYIFSITPGIPENSFMLIIAQNIVVAILGGIALSNYLVDDTKNTMWLAICGLLFVALHFVLFIERYYLSGAAPVIFRPITMTLSATAFYCFYRFVLASESSSYDDRPAD